MTGRITSGSTSRMTSSRSFPKRRMLDPDLFSECGDETVQRGSQAPCRSVLARLLKKGRPSEGVVAATAGFGDFTVLKKQDVWLRESVSSCGSHAVYVNMQHPKPMGVPLLPSTKQDSTALTALTDGGSATEDYVLVRSQKENRSRQKQPGVVAAKSVAGVKSRSVLVGGVHN